MFVIIPIKPFEKSKTRLATQLSVGQRMALSRYMLLQTIRLARQVGKVVVISQSQRVRQQAKQAGAWALVEADTGLNAAIRQAAEWVAARGEEAALVLPADLPLLTLSNLTEMMSLGQQSPAIVIAPCHRGKGTNALLVRPPTLINFNFGPDSFALHRQAARAFGLEPIIYQSPTVALDIDTPADLEKVLPTQPGLNLELERQIGRNL